MAGVPVVAETCPHYLNFASEDVPEGDTRFKCAPPIRDAKNREAIWEGLISGVVDSLASDHSPAPAEMKMLEDGDFSAAWGGVAGAAFGVQAPTPAPFWGKVDQSVAMTRICPGVYSSACTDHTPTRQCGRKRMTDVPLA